MYTMVFITVTMCPVMIVGMKNLLAQGHEQNDYFLISDKL